MNWKDVQRRRLGMYVELLARSERCIEQQHDHELTVSALWDKVRAIAAKEHFIIPDTITDFECLLDGDKRFKLSEMKSADGEGVMREIDEDDEFLDTDEIEGLGFDHEQKVTLARFYVEDDADETEDEAFAPRPFAKNEDHADGAPAPRLKKLPAAREKKTVSKTKSTKRK
jgi:hypothetical protein